MLIAFIMMDRQGLSANLQSLGGLAIGIGMMVDGSIVMIENIVRHLAESNPPPDQRLATVEEKLRSMDEEMASLRQAAFRESAAERERIEQSASSDAGKILSSAEQEIDSAPRV